MRKVLILILAGVSLLCSCAHLDSDGSVVNQELAVVFGPAMSTRAFFDGDPQGEPWEREIHRVTVVLCDEHGNHAAAGELSAQEIAEGKFTIPIYYVKSGVQYLIYLFANYDYPLNGNLSTWQIEGTLADRDVTKYNGEYEAMRSGCINPDGFVMTAKGTITTDNTVANPLLLELKRTVSKLELLITVGDNLTEQFPNGEIILINTILKPESPDGSLFEQISFPSLEEEVELHQIPEAEGNLYRNVFYIFPDQGEIQLVVSGLFYPVGFYGNPHFFIPCNYSINVKEKTKANTYYRITGRIDKHEGITDA